MQNEAAKQKSTRQSVRTEINVKGVTVSKCRSNTDKIHRHAELSTCVGNVCIMVFSHQSKTRRQMLNLCIPMMPFTPYIAGPGVKGIMGMHRFNICLVVLFWCENTITVLIMETPLLTPYFVVLSCKL